MDKIYHALLTLVFFSGAISCTSTFEDTNTNPYGVTQEDRKQDYLNVGGYFAPLQQNIYNISTDLQVEQNLTGDAFAQYMVTPTPFMSNRNNVTYKFVWYGNRWNNDYSKIMPVIFNFKINQVDKQYPNFYAWANILKIFAMQRVTDNYGPIIYSNYGTSNPTINYDTQQKVYYSFFNELDSAITVLSAYEKQESSIFRKFDLAYGGNVGKWLKAANSLRLRLAIRISKVDPDKAKVEAEKAVNNPYGLIEANSDNFMVSLNSATHPLWTFSNGWNDCRMCATVGSILGGYNDPRLPIYFSPATDADVAGKYVGIRQGIDISSKITYVNFASIGSMFETAQSVQIMTAAEVAFLRAE
ncbi:MAG: SusD/RagB family nutrient-binding outer membrane lipoprotein, partial [Bacteroidota bacterium]|nr:SusD/RagB family nutrient-binding outer membrane lipoprotein [Bacteroidota bacterium]